MDIFKKFKIQTSDILDSDKNNNIIKGYYYSLVHLNKELNSILIEKNSLSIVEKQKALEKLSEITQSYDMGLEYQVPKTLTKLILKLDDVLLDSDRLEDNNVRLYFPTVLAKIFGEHSNLKRTNKTKDLTITINIFKDILRLFNGMGVSFGLFLVYNLTSTLRAGFNDRSLKKQVQATDKITKKLIFNVLDDANSDKNASFLKTTLISLEIKRVVITEKFGKELIKTSNNLLKTCLYNIQKLSLDKIVNYSNYSEEIQSQKTRELLVKNKDLNKLEIFDMAMGKYKDGFLVDDIQSAKLGMQCVSILEAVNILDDAGLLRHKTKTISKVKIGKKYADDVYSLPSKPKNLPMIVRPNFWELKQKTENSSTEISLNYGGYRYNKVLNYPATTIHRKNGVSRITKDDLQSLNFLQSNFYRINGAFLEYIVSDFKNVAAHYLSKIENVSCFIPNLRNNTEEITLQSFTTALEKDKLLTLLRENFKNSSTKKLTNQIQARRDTLTDEYYNAVNKFFGLIHAYIIAFNYKDYQFYFTTFLDNRGRIYYNTTGSSFGLQTGDFSRALIDLKGNKFDFKNTIIHNNPEVVSLTKDMLSFYRSLDSKKDFFQKTRIDKGIMLNTISNDASCSGTSILSGILGSTKGLFLTNVITEEHSDFYEKQSAYTEFLAAMEKNYPADYQSLYTPDCIEHKTQNLKIDTKEFILLIDKVLKRIQPNILTRDHAKQFFMKINYSETDHGRFRYIHDNILVPILLVENIDYNHLEKRVFNSVCSRLARWVGFLYVKEFPELSKFCECLSTHFETTHNIILSCPENSQFNYEELLCKTVKIPRPGLLTNHDLNVYIQTDEPDHKKVARSIVANFIHYLDSRLNFLVISKCRKSSILIWSNHDCWYTSAENKPKLLKYYYDSFIELLLKTDVIEHFLNINNIKPDNTFTKLLNEYKENRILILKAIKKGNYKMSKYILSS